MSPGPDPYIGILTREGSSMTRLHSTAGLGPGILSADQQDMRTKAKGFDGDPATAPKGGHSYVFRLTRHEDGTADSVRLDPTADGWIDQGGPTPRDFKAVRP